MISCSLMSLPDLSPRDRYSRLTKPTYRSLSCIVLSCVMDSRTEKYEKYGGIWWFRELWIDIYLHFEIKRKIIRYCEIRYAK